MIKILIVEDSNFMRMSLKKLLGEVEDFEVRYIARHGLEALQIIEKNDVDVVLLDLFMPKMDGIETLKNIMKIKPLPVLVFTGADKEKDADILMMALKLGALDIVQKPTGINALNIEDVKFDLIQKLRAAYLSRDKLKVFINNSIIHKTISNETEPKIQYKTYSEVQALKGGPIEKSILKKTARRSDKKFSARSLISKLFVFGASTGGPPQLINFLKGLIFNPRIAGIIVQHIPGGFTPFLAKRLDTLTDYLVKEAEDGEKIQAGVIYVAPGDYHLKVLENNGDIFFEITQEERVWGVRPCIDYTLVTAAKVFKDRCVAIIITGMGRDGTFGIRIIKEYGGYTIAQDPEEAMIDSMPLNAINSGHIDKILTVPEISMYINQL